MSLLSFFGINTSDSTEIPDIFPFPFPQSKFVEADMVSIYSRIITDVLERTDGIPEEKQNLFWDNCVASESTDGLVTLVAKAMVQKADLFVVYDNALKLIRKANAAETAQIRADYAKGGESSQGVFITFKNYSRTDMVAIYSALEYCTVASLSKQMNLSKALQIKISDLRASVSLSDSASAKAQVVEIANALKAGKDTYCDAKDMIETAKPDLTATKASMEFITEKRAFYLEMPVSYITGVTTKAMSDSGQADAKQVERGLKGYYFSIVKPILEAVLQVKSTFRTEDYDQITSACETLTTFEATGEELISQENKLKIINKLFGLPDNAKGDPPKKVEAIAPPKVSQPPGKVPPPAP